MAFFKPDKINSILRKKPLTKLIAGGESQKEALLTAVSTANGSNNLKVVESELTTANSENFLQFKFSLPKPWLVGKYKVDLLRDGKPDRTLDFEVK